MLRYLGGLRFVQTLDLPLSGILWSLFGGMCGLFQGGWVVSV